MGLSCAVACAYWSVVRAQLDLCKMGDAYILEAVGGLYKKNKDMKKGVAFPTCVSVNECVCAFSPMESTQTLAAGDLVKM